MRMVNEKRQQLVLAEDRIRNSMERRLEDAKHRLELIIGQLHGLSPLKRRVRQNVKAKTAFFELSEREWNGILDRVYKDYENLMGAMYGMWW